METAPLIAFLRARLKEDEHAARAAKPGPWRWAREQPHTMLLVGSQPWSAEFGHDVVVPIADGERYPSRFDADHIVRHDPSRVLAEVDAKRRILDQVGKPPHAFYWWSDHEPTPAALAILKPLALPFADHPDYREEWRP